MVDDVSRRGFIKQAATGLAAGAVLPIAAQTQAQTAGGTSLYARLGGYDAIAAVTDDFIGRLANDRQLSKFFVGHSTHSLGRIRQLVVEQLCQAAGGPCVYIGRDMKTAHKGLGISESDWQVTVKHLTATFDKFKVPERERSELVAFLSTLKGDIVEKA